MLIQFSAEAFDRTYAPELLKKLRAADIDVLLINRCYGGELTLVCDITDDQAKEVQRYIWEFNHGLCAEYWNMTADDLEEMM